MQNEITLVGCPSLNLMYILRLMDTVEKSLDRKDVFNLCFRLWFGRLHGNHPPAVLQMYILVYFAK